MRDFVTFPFLLVWWGVNFLVKYAIKACITIGYMTSFHVAMVWASICAGFVDGYMIGEQLTGNLVPSEDTDNQEDTTDEQP